MTVIVEDTFNEAGQTNLDAHDADPTGDTWNKSYLFGNPTSVFEIPDGVAIARCVPARPADGLCYGSRPNPTTVEYDIEWEWKAIDTSGDDPAGVFARGLDDANYYWFLAYGNSGTSIGIKDTGSHTVLDSDAVVDAGVTTFKFEIRNAAKKVYKTGSEILSTDDDVLTAAGECGVAAGAYGDTSGDDISVSWQFDNYKVTEVAAPTGPGAAIFPRTRPIVRL